MHNVREKRNTATVDVTFVAEISCNDAGNVGQALEATHGRARRATNSKSGFLSTFLLWFWRGKIVY